MKLAVFGAGGVGAYYGAGFARGGAQVDLIAEAPISTPSAGMA